MKPIYRKYNLTKLIHEEQNLNDGAIIEDKLINLI